MVLALNTSRALRAREESSDDDDEPHSDELEASSPSVLATGDGGEILSSESYEANASLDGSVIDVESSRSEDVKEELSKVSFGALARAQDVLSSKQRESCRKRRRGPDNATDQDDKLRALRARLRTLKKQKATSGDAKKVVKRTKTEESPPDPGDFVDDDVRYDQQARCRSSKHAPVVMSSKKPVGRKREALAPRKRAARDPRFDGLPGSLDSNKAKHNYAFLDQYRESEMAELKTTIKKTKNDKEKESLKRKLLSMESRKKARQSKERLERITREHKKQQKGAVKQGKMPYFLKKSEIKKRALVDQFANMKGKQRERLIERRHRKAAAQEKKNMPTARKPAAER